MRFIASPGPPGFDGRGTPDDAEVIDADVAVAAGAVVGAETAVSVGVAEEEEAAVVPDVEAGIGFKLMTYAITSAICCCVNFPESPQGGIEKVGLGPSGVEPC